MLSSLLLFRNSLIFVFLSTLTLSKVLKFLNKRKHFLKCISVCRLLHCDWVIFVISLLYGTFWSFFFSNYCMINVCKCLHVCSRRKFTLYYPYVKFNICPKSLPHWLPYLDFLNSYLFFIYVICLLLSCVCILLLLVFLSMRLCTSTVCFINVISLFLGALMFITMFSIFIANCTFTIKIYPLSL